MRLFILCCAVMLFAGCTGKHCLSIGGGYKGIIGEGQWCWEEAQSKEVGSPILVSSDKTAVLITEEDAGKLNAEFMGESSVKDVKAQDISQIKKLLERVHRK